MAASAACASRRACTALEYAVDVYERTQTRTDWLQGYRIHINPSGSRALHDCLPPAAWQRFLNTVSVDDGGFGFTTEHLDDLLRFAGAEITRSMPARLTLTTAPAGSACARCCCQIWTMSYASARGSTRYETGLDGRVTAHFADGTSATADVLIGADGANSRVRRPAAPQARRIDTGILAIAGKHRLDVADLPRTLREDANIVIPARQGLPVHRGLAARQQGHSRREPAARLPA